MSFMEGMRSKRWFRLGFVGWLTTTGVSIAFVGYLGWVFYKAMEESGIGIDEKVAIQVFEEDTEQFGRKARKTVSFEKLMKEPEKREKKEELKDPNGKKIRTYTNRQEHLKLQEYI